MKSVAYLIVAVLAVAGFASAGGKKHFVPGGTIQDPVRGSPGKLVAGPRAVRSLFIRRAVVVKEQ